MKHEKIVGSPCISICALDAADICAGCYRSAVEITQWSGLSNSQKQEVIVKAYEREKRVNPFLS